MRVVHVLRKPLSEGTVASNTLKHGCGGLNIDGSRIAGVKEVPGGKARTAEQGAAYGDLGAQATGPDGRGVTSGWDPNTGRFPANVILQHLDGCECRGTRKVKGHKGYPNGPGGKSDPMHGWGGKRSTEVRPNAWSSPATDSEGKETIAMWECAEGCPAARLDEQSGDSRSDGLLRHNSAHKSVAKGAEAPHVTTGHGDTGGASRFFKQIGGKVSE
jgi:hypothetical protein